MHVIEMVREGGAFAFVVIGLGLLATLLSTVALVTSMVVKTRQPGLTLAIAAMVTGLLVPVSGGVGYALAMRNVFAAVDAVDPASRATILAQGIAEAMNLIVFGAVCGGVPCLFALVAAIRAATRPKTAPAP